MSDSDSPIRPSAPGVVGGLVVLGAHLLAGERGAEVPQGHGSAGPVGPPLRRSAHQVLVAVGVGLGEPVRVDAVRIVHWPSLGRGRYPAVGVDEQAERAGGGVDRGEQPALDVLELSGRLRMRAAALRICRAATSYSSSSPSNTPNASRRCHPPSPSDVTGPSPPRPPGRAAWPGRCRAPPTRWPPRAGPRAELPAGRRTSGRPTPPAPGDASNITLFDQTAGRRRRSGPVLVGVAVVTGAGLQRVGGRVQPLPEAAQVVAPPPEQFLEP